MDMETQNSKDRAKYAHLKRDILGDGIKESKLAAYETLAKNLNNNSGDGNESLPAYGIYWMGDDVLYIFEINDINNPLYELQQLASGNDVEFKKLLFKGEFDADSTYVRVDGEITDSITQPMLVIEQASGRDDFKPSDAYSFIDETTNILEFANINKGFVFGIINDDGDSFAGVVRNPIFQTTGISGAYFIT